MTYTDGQLIDKYIDLRAKEAAVNEQFAGILEPIKKAKGAIEAEMLKRLNGNGQQSVKAASGAIAFKSITQSVKVKDREAWFEFVLADWPNRVGMLTSAVAKDAVREYIGQQGSVPQGIELTEIVNVNFRKG